nr:MAG TPA: hypothetical protein [Caudoviricetes sp.]
MKIPKIISKNGHEYIFVKEYPNFILYQDMLTGVKETFQRYDLGLVKQVKIIRPNLRKNMNMKP